MPCLPPAPSPTDPIENSRRSSGVRYREGRGSPRGLCQITRNKACGAAPCVPPLACTHRLPLLSLAMRRASRLATLWYDTLSTCVLRMVCMRHGMSRATHWAGGGQILKPYHTRRRWGRCRGPRGPWLRTPPPAPASPPAPPPRLLPAPAPHNERRPRQSTSCRPAGLCWSFSLKERQCKAALHFII